MQQLTNAPIDLNPKHIDALRKLTDIFNEAARVTDTDKENMPAPRVNSPAPRVQQPAPRVLPTTSHDPTAPKVIAAQPRIHQRVTRRNNPMPMIHEESPRSLQRTRTRENKNKAPPVLTARPRRTIAQAQYKQKQAALNRATPTKYPSPTNKGPRYITQDDEEELANLLFNEALPNIVKTNQLTSEDAEHNQANLLHTKLYQKSMPKTQLHNLKTPLGINSQAVIKLMGTHLENPHHHCFIPGTFQNSTISLTHKWVGCWFKSSVLVLLTCLVIFVFTVKGGILSLRIIA
jgi:hypothetical protein